MANTSPGLKNSAIKSLRATKLKLELESFKEVVKRSQDAVFKEQAIYNKKMQEVWGKTLQFVENANLYHDTKGISSPWWNAQVLRIQNPVLYQENFARRLKKTELETLLKEIKEKELVVTDKEKEILKLKEKLSNETARILDLKKIENELHQEPFGFEFNSLKAKVEYSKQTCLELGTRLSWSTGTGGLEHPQESSNLRFQPKEPRRQLTTSTPKYAGETVKRNTTKIPKYLKVRERTTLIYRSEAFKSNNMNNYSKENEMLQFREHENSEAEITHS